uniref:Ataxin-2 C-terminal domain-containing protein n=1 Tax=Lactuca sativa TaxID=4236 RepID=A0A9R1UNQ0_LACSA|nr:hypothetical protein LSAT_V11C800417430 [Lactuca sativa]
MSLSNQGASAIDKKLITTGKTIRLNPDAAEFVPFALRSPSASVAAPDASSSFGNFGATTPGKAVLDRSESSVSNNSDDEAHQYWRHQLPDDITPDFHVAGEEDPQGINTLPFSTLSLADVNETNGNSFNKKMGYPISSSSASFQPAKPWDIHGDQLHNGPSYNGDPVHGYLDDMLNEQQMEGTEVNPLEFLASQFAGFAAESLADVYFANGGDLNLTIEMLTQLELQVDGGGLNQNLNSKALSSPNLSAMDFPALSPTDDQNGVQQHINPYRPLEKENLLMFKSSSGGAPLPSGGATDFASAVRKMASQDSSIWKYNRNPSQDSTIGSSRSSHVLASAYNNGGHGRVSYGDRLGGRSSNRSAPVWLETGDAVGNN